MIDEVKGWVIINENHPNGNSKMLVSSSFSRTRKEAISIFIDGSGSSWKNWKKKMNFRCVKAIQTIKTE